MARRTRPEYETESDRAEQRAVARVLRVVWPVQCELYPKFSTADYKFVQNGQITAIGEHKRRHVNHDTYPDLIISRAKVRRLLIMAYERQINALLIAHYNDELRWVQLKNEHLSHSRIAGRVDRGDAFDIEKCVVVLNKEFKRIKVPPRLAHTVWPEKTPEE